MCEKAHENIVVFRKLVTSIVSISPNNIFYSFKEKFCLLSHLNCVIYAHAFNLDKSTSISSVNSKDGTKIYFPSNTCSL